MRETSTFDLRLIVWIAVSAVVWLGSCGGADGGDAQGFGATTPGGSGRPVVQVTSLADSGPGSLREAVSAGQRMVVFGVAGTIHLGSVVPVRGPYVTIDGHSAPPPGITLRNHGIRVGGTNVHDVIIRGIRVRNPRTDGIGVREGAHSVLIDHVSIDGARDGNIDVTHGAHDVTVSWSVLSASAKNMLIKYDAARVSLHHNVFVNSQFRNPFLSNRDDGTPAAGITADIRNNLIWGWGNNGGGTGIECGAKANVVGNFYSSPNTRRDRQERALFVQGCSRGSGGLAHVAGNVSADGIDLNVRGNQPAPYPAPPVDTTDACSAAADALAGAGVHPRDGIDQSHLGRISIRCS